MARGLEYLDQEDDSPFRLTRKEIRRDKFREEKQNGWLTSPKRSHYLQNAQNARKRFRQQAGSDSGDEDLK